MTGSRTGGHACGSSFLSAPASARPAAIRNLGYDLKKAQPRIVLSFQVIPMEFV
jgi:hypothetical protein